MNRDTIIILVLSLFVGLCVITIFVLIMYYFIMRKKSSFLDGDSYDISAVAYACHKTKDDHCLCSKTMSGQLCFHQDNEDSIDIVIPSLDSKHTISLKGLSTDENNPYRFKIFQTNIGAFLSPFQQDVLCLRSLSNPTNPQRLCYQMKEHQVFISGPTSFVPMDI